MNPFPGLRPFTAEERQYFSGRETILSSVATRVRIVPVTLLVARSGMGKSSFLNCRLLPELGTNSRIHYRNEWGSSTAEELIRTDLARLGEASDQFAEKPILVLDQFEDVFKIQTRHHELWDTLAEYANVPEPPVNLLIAMREEWLGAWGESVDYLPEGLHSVLRLAPLTERELHRAIERPVAVEGTVRVDDELVRELLADLKRPNVFGMGELYIEPGLLQLVCHRLWAEAAATPNGAMDVDLYKRLGRADRIVRDFVWSELGHAGTPSSQFTTADRVLWVGMTRHLVVAQGIKAIADATAIAKKIRMEDLGFAGPAIARKQLGSKAAAFLTTMPERRAEPPRALVDWIVAVVRKGVAVGFLKQQGAARTADHRVNDATRLFEICHDALADLFQQFSVEYEGWVRTRWAVLVGIMIGVLVILPVTIVSGWDGGLMAMVILFFTLLLGFVLYIALVVLLMLIGGVIFRLIGYPIVRALAAGVVPLPRASTGRSWLVERVRDLARKSGFLPK